MFASESKVLLPRWIFDEAGGNTEEIRRLVRRYISKSYPDYQIVKVQGRFAICERGKKL